ncbi:hypothetical protein GR215_31620 [Rhizobium leguminosarum]|uniref:hypothetical protein n=1 Tax=Rhizobium leguminosarum TaxID=384 RepID=UPI0013B899A1|nr:hypothetical protein [Rhizobium leguminosarum]NEH46387.1 hypothetical protein [Rhizobium leguminosarum]
MTDLSLFELRPPPLQFGGAASTSDPKSGLDGAGPFDLRFGSARKESINVGAIGPAAIVESAQKWLTRCSAGIPSFGPATSLRRPFPGFSEVFRKKLVFSAHLTVTLGDVGADSIALALAQTDAFQRFQTIVDLYDVALQRLAGRDVNRPDVVLVCLPQNVLDKCKTVERQNTEAERERAKAIRKARASRQTDFFDLLDEVEESEDDFLKRDLRHALKAKALAARLPIQIVTPRLLEDGPKTEDPATRAWNFSVGLYYKAGGVPWRLSPPGPETCFVGISFHHYRTKQRHVVQSSLAQAFSSEGEGFAIRGTGVPAEADQRLNVHLSHDQAFDLGERIIAEYASRTGRSPLRLVIHKTSQFDAAEIKGFRAALGDIPILSLVTMVPSAFRLVRFGMYPPKVGTICTVNGARTFLYTSGYIPELETYPGPHIPQPFEVRVIGPEDPLIAATDIFNLTRMNWNTADIRGKWPVTLSFARRVGGILNEYGEQDPEETSFRYFV